MQGLTFDNLLVGIMIIYIIYIVMKKKNIQSGENFEDTLPLINTVEPIINAPKMLKTNKQCSDLSINEAVFKYSLNKLNQIKTPN